MNEQEYWLVFARVKEAINESMMRVCVHMKRIYENGMVKNVFETKLIVERKVGRRSKMDR